MGEKTYLRNRDVILNRTKDYYENDKERLREQVRLFFWLYQILWSLSLYLIKYLNEFFVPYGGSSLETNILLALTSSILVTFLFL